MACDAPLNIYYTASLLKRKVDVFLRPYSLTNVQFNVLMPLHHQNGREEGLSQTHLSDIILVNRANTIALIDQMERV